VGAIGPSTILNRQSLGGKIQYRMVKWPRSRKWGVFHRHPHCSNYPGLETGNAAVTDNPYITPISTKPYHCIAVFSFRRPQAHLFLFWLQHAPTCHLHILLWPCKMEAAAARRRSATPHATAIISFRHLVGHRQLLTLNRNNPLESLSVEDWPFDHHSLPAFAFSCEQGASTSFGSQSPFRIASFS